MIKYKPSNLSLIKQDNQNKQSLFAVNKKIPANCVIKKNYEGGGETEEGKGKETKKKKRKE